MLPSLPLLSTIWYDSERQFDLEDEDMDSDHPLGC